MSDFWKVDWDRAKSNLIKWWELKGPAISIMAPKSNPRGNYPPPERDLYFSQPNGPRVKDITAPKVEAFPVPDDARTMWLDPEIRFKAAEHIMANTFYCGEAFPYFDTHLGPGNLAAFIGAKPEFSKTDAWYTHTMPDINDGPPFTFDENNEWFRAQVDIIEYGVRHADGRFLVSIPDLIENIDTLASLRGTTEILTDMALDPDSVRRRCFEINEVFFQAFNRIYDLVRDDDNGSCFSVFDLWAPGKCYKVQVDIGAMIGPDMFEDIALGPLREQCEKIDYCFFHLDGSQCFVHLDHILSIENIRAVEWTPEPGMPGGGDPKWYDLYRRIKDAGKSVQAIFIKPEEIDPLFEAIGPEGVFLQIRVETEDEARRILDRCQKWYH